VHLLLVEEGNSGGNMRTDFTARLYENSVGLLSSGNKKSIALFLATGGDYLGDVDICGVWLEKR